MFIQKHTSIILIINGNYDFNNPIAVISKNYENGELKYKIESIADGYKAYWDGNENKWQNDYSSKEPLEVGKEYSTKIESTNYISILNTNFSNSVMKFSVRNEKGELLDDCKYIDNEYNKCRYVIWQNLEDADVKTYYDKNGKKLASVKVWKNTEDSNYTFAQITYLAEGWTMYVGGDGAATKISDMVNLNDYRKCTKAFSFLNKIPISDHAVEYSLVEEKTGNIELNLKTIGVNSDGTESNLMLEGFECAANSYDTYIPFDKDEQTGKFQYNMELKGAETAIYIRQVIGDKTKYPILEACAIKLKMIKSDDKYKCSGVFIVNGNGTEIAYVDNTGTIKAASSGTGYYSIPASLSNVKLEYNEGLNLLIIKNKIQEENITFEISNIDEDNNKIENSSFKVIKIAEEDIIAKAVEYYKSVLKGKPNLDVIKDLVIEVKNNKVEFATSAVQKGEKTNIAIIESDISNEFNKLDYIVLLTFEKRGNKFVCTQMIKYKNEAVETLKLTDNGTNLISVSKDLIYDNTSNKLAIKQQRVITREAYVYKLWEMSNKPEVSSITTFEDISKYSEYIKAISWAQKGKLVIGTGNNKFSPKEYIKRGDAVLILYRLAGEPESESTQTFEDIPENSYYKKAVDWALQNGIAKGTGNSKFLPEEPCKMKEAIAFLERYFGLIEKNEVKLTINCLDSNKNALQNQNLIVTGVNGQFTTNEKGTATIILPITEEENKKGEKIVEVKSIAEKNSDGTTTMLGNRALAVCFQKTTDDNWKINYVSELGSSEDLNKIFTWSLDKEKAIINIMSVNNTSESKISLKVNVEYETEDEKPLYDLTVEVTGGTTDKTAITGNQETIVIVPNDNAEKVRILIHRKAKDSTQGDGQTIWVNYEKEDGAWVAGKIGDRVNATFSDNVLTINMETKSED